MWTAVWSSRMRSSMRTSTCSRRRLCLKERENGEGKSQHRCTPLRRWQRVTRVSRWNCEVVRFVELVEGATRLGAMWAVSTLLAVGWSTTTVTPPAASAMHPRGHLSS